METTPACSTKRSTIVLIVSILLWFTAADARRTGFAVHHPRYHPHRNQRDVLGLGRRSSSSLSVPSIIDRPRTASEWELLKLRGGADEVEDEEDESEDEDDDEDLFDTLDEESDSLLGNDDASDDFTGEDDMGKRLVKAWVKTPPLTKGYLSAAAAAAVCGMALYKNEFPTFMAWDGVRMWKRLELWRPFTSFLNFGPLGISYLMSMQFVWMYMSTLERMNHNKPYDFLIMILFGMASMIIGYPVLKLNPRLLGHNLSTYLVYIWSRNHEGVEVSFFDILTFKAELLPWVFLAQTYLLEGEPPVLDLLGIAFGHVYYHLKRIGMLRAPDSLVQWYEKSDGAAALRELYKPIAADFDPV
jgi:Derlin-2/3